MNMEKKYIGKEIETACMTANNARDNWESNNRDIMIALHSGVFMLVFKWFQR